MSKDLNKVMLTGRLGRDPDLKFTPQGSAVCTASVASSRSVRDENEEGGWREETEWFRVIAWNELAERIANAIHVGDRVYIEGRIQTREWTDQKSGEKRRITEVIANDYILLERKGEAAASSEGDDETDDSEGFFGVSNKNTNQRGGQGQSQPSNQRNAGKNQPSRSTPYSANSQNRRNGSGGSSSRYQAGYQDEQELNTEDIPF